MKNAAATRSMAGMCAANAQSNKKFAVVTGANKGIGFEICKQLASHGVSVVLTARNEQRGLEAVEKLKRSGLSDHVTFHQLDVTDSRSIDDLAGFIKSHIGKLDILVNNAGFSGTSEGAHSASQPKKTAYDLAVECFQINYYGLRNTTRKLLPLLELSDSPRIVHVSSTMGRLSGVQNKLGRGILEDAANLSEERIDQVISEFLKDFKEGALQSKGWPTYWGAYCVSKAAVNAYTRLLSRKHPGILINSVCPGWVDTDLSNHSGPLTPKEGAESPVRLALLPDGGPSGVFFDRKHQSSF